MEHFWSVALSIGGLGAVGAFVFWSLYKGWLKLGIFRELDSAQTFRLMTIFLILTFAFCALALVGFLLRNKVPDSRPPVPVLSLESLKNGSYKMMDGDAITLQDGRRRWQSKPDDMKDYIDVEFLEVAFGDLNNDGAQDAAVVLSENGGGSGTFMYLFPVLNNAGAPKVLSSLGLGDRNVFKSVSIDNGVVEVQYLTRGPNDGLCCPSVLTKIHAELIVDHFVCIDQECKDHTG